MKGILFTLTLAGIACVTTGCERGLFAENLPRTQYERYDKMRGVYRPKVTTDPRGQEVPDLRARLSVYQ